MWSPTVNTGHESTASSSCRPVSFHQCEKDAQVQDETVNQNIKFVISSNMIRTYGTFGLRPEFCLCLCLCLCLCDIIIRSDVAALQFLVQARWVFHAKSECLNLNLNLNLNLVPGLCTRLPLSLTLRHCKETLFYQCFYLLLVYIVKSWQICIFYLLVYACNINNKLKLAWNISYKVMTSDGKLTTTSLDKMQECGKMRTPVICVDASPVGTTRFSSAGVYTYSTRLHM